MEKEQFDEIIAKCRNISQIDEKKYAMNKLVNIAKERGYSSIKSKSLCGKTFVSEEPEFFIVYGMNDKENYFTMILYKIKTTGGLLYVTFLRHEVTGFITSICFSSHVFDRFLQRTGLDKKRRSDSVRAFLKEIIGNGALTKTSTKKLSLNFLATLFMNNGLLLGEGMFDHQQGKAVVLYKTFVSEDTVRTDQEKLRRNEVLKFAKVLDSGNVGFR